MISKDRLTHLKQLEAESMHIMKEVEDIRAGRWWWENPEHKECGLHKK